MNKNALIIFAKTPIPNFSKTRLINPFTLKQAAEFYSASLKDIFNTMHNTSDFNLWIAIAPENFDKNLFPLNIDSINYFFQTGDDLGIRMLNAFDELFEQGYKKTAIIGSDFPHISIEVIKQTFNKLDRYDCVLGPAVDGGYYLIGLKKCYESIFKDIDWSTEKVFQQTTDKAQQNNISVKNLKVGYDVDTVNEVKQLYLDLKEMDSSLINFPVNVWQFLQTHKNIYL